MFDYNKIIQRAVEFFPSWTDIRKRYKKSRGGKYLQATTEEILDIEKAIQEYIDMYFLDRYEGKVDDILAYTYMTSIGNIDYTKITVHYSDEQLSLTNNITEFLNADNLAYYEDGYIHIKDTLHDSKNLDTIKIFIEDSWLNYNLTKHSVWNIFDEFACFVGLRRHENETNQSLIDRILYRTKNLPNASEDGLKNSIISNIMDKVSIDKDDIEIERLTSESLRKQYEGFETLLDFLSDMNRDVYKDKKWDLDLWQYDFKSIKYIDHKWNETLKEYQNGVGYGDDLKVIMSNSTTSTDAKVTLYKKSEQKLTEYVHNKNIPKNIKFRLKRYNNILNSQPLQYRIKASEAYDITNKDIELSVYENEVKSEKRKIDELYKIGSGVSLIDRSKITDSNRYRLEFYPMDNLKMEISKCKVVYKDKTTKEVIETRDLIEPYPGFIINGDGALVNTSIKKMIKSVEGFNERTDLVNTQAGIEIRNNGSYGRGTVSLSGLAYMQLNCEMDYNLADLPKSNVKLNPYCYFDTNNDIVLRHDITPAKIVDIEVEANIVSFDLESGNNIDISIDDGYGQGYVTKQYTGTNHIETSLSDKPRKIKIRINATNISTKTVISNLKYSSHELILALEKGEILKTSTGSMVLPNYSQNTLIVTMKSYSGLSPVLKRIYIGSEMDNLSYKTDVIPYLNNCDRIFEVTSNCKVDLVEINASGAVLNRIENYESTNVYKALSNDAWIRLNLSEYESVQSVKTSIGKVKMIEESGVMYYNIELTSGDIISNVVIEGIKNYESKRMSLIDMIKVYVPSFNKSRDRIFCSLISEGVVVEIHDTDTPRSFELKIASEVFTGISASKFKISKIPDNIGSVFVYGNNRNQSYEHDGSFDYLSFYPAAAREHIALNEYDMFLNEVRNIKVVNNFNPPTLKNTLYMYKVELYNSETINAEIKFCDASDNDIPFENLRDFAIGEKNIGIKNNNDLNNTISYDVTSYEIDEEILLSKYIPIKSEYKIDDNFTIYTDRYIVEPINKMDVEYKYFNGTSENEYMIKTEQLIVESDGFNKLEYSNIDKLLYLGTEPYDGKDRIEFDTYNLLKDEGIIVWTDSSFISKAPKVYIRYTVREATALIYDTDELYKAIDYTVDAYDEISKHTIKDMHEEERYDLRNIEGYADADLVHVACVEPSFEAVLSNNMLRFKKFAEENTVLIKTGFYYINGKEYYLFSNNDTKELDNKSYMESQNIEKIGGEIYLYKATDNYIRNSEMLLRGMNELYEFNCAKKPTYGISDFNSLTACDSYNLWTTFEMGISLDSGLNGSCLNFNQKVKNGYAFIELTEYLSDESIISLYADESLKVFIGEEEKIDGATFTEALNIEVKSEMMAEDEKIREKRLIKKDDTRYYLVVSGKGRLDDIIIKKFKNESYLIGHDKNIDKLGLNISEQKTEGVIFRMPIKGNKYCINNGATITRDGSIRISPNVFWGITKIYEYDTKEDFTKCILSGVSVENDYIATSRVEGQMMTEPIFIDNPLTIKRLFFKINDIDFDNMTNIETTIYASNSKSGPFRNIMYFKNNIGYLYGDYLDKYIKIKLDIPADKIVNNLSVFVEYKSDKQNAPKLYMPNTGELITKVYDAQENLDYKVKSISIDDVSNMNDVEISIRASRDKYSADVWMDWKTLTINNKKQIVNTVEFEDSRFYQMKIKITGKDTYIKMNHLDLEVKG